MAKHFEAQLEKNKNLLLELRKRKPNSEGVIEYTPEEQLILEAADYIKSLPTFDYSSEKPFRIIDSSDELQKFLT